MSIFTFFLSGRYEYNTIDAAERISLSAMDDGDGGNNFFIGGIECILLLSTRTGAVGDLDTSPSVMQPI